MDCSSRSNFFFIQSLITHGVAEYLNVFTNRPTYSNFTHTKYIFFISLRVYKLRLWNQLHREEKSFTSFTQREKKYRVRRNGKHAVCSVDSVIVLHWLIGHYSLTVCVCINCVFHNRLVTFSVNYVCYFLFSSKLNYIPQLP